MAMNLTLVGALTQAESPDGGMLPAVGFVDGDYAPVSARKD